MYEASFVRYTFCARVVLFPDYGINSIEKQSVVGYLDFRMQKAPAGCRGLLKGGYGSNYIDSFTANKVENGSIDFILTSSQFGLLAGRYAA